MLLFLAIGPSSGNDAGSYSRSIIKAYGMNVDSSVPIAAPVDPLTAPATAPTAPAATAAGRASAPPDGL
jgi:hypothetical protein